MSLSVTKIVNLPQAALKFLVQDEAEDEPAQDWKTLGGVFSNADYAWLACGPRLEIVHNKMGNKVGAWTFGWVLRDANTHVVCVDEIQRPNGRLPLLAVGLDCDFSGGMICIFDFVTSKIIRAIHIDDKITKFHVIDAGYDVFTLPGPLRNFDGIIAVGTAGGDVFLVDICRQICDEALTTGGLSEIRDELNPSLLSNITSRDLARIEHHKEFAIRNGHHLAIHLNIVFDKSTKHFILKGPKGDDRIHVNKDEVAVSALYYCPQLGSLLIGYNFGALQLYDLMNLELVYTSPVCDEHIPISHFAVQEPADDPRAVCYIWAIYSAEERATCLPLAVMYAFCYQSKEYHEGYGCLYQDFGSASVHFQMELAVPQGHKRLSKLRGGNCLKVNSIIHGVINREEPHNESNEDNLTLCVFLWSVWFSNKESDTFLAIFDLNQWYKEQMPNVLNAQYSPTYMLQIHLNDLINSASNRSAPIIDASINKNSIQQFTGAQRLEEHFYPNSITFGMTCLRDGDIIFLHNYGVQKALLAQTESAGPLCLVEPADIYQEIVGLGLVPLFIDLPINTPVTTNQQREVILGAALENHLMGWLCKCASEWSNGSFLSAGCSLELLVTWAFQRAIALKTNCDKFCTSLFDYSQVRLDNNASMLLNSCTRQLKNLHSLYTFILRKFAGYVSNIVLVEEQYKSLETVSVYFEVLQWLLNVGLLPECPLTSYPHSDDLDRISAPYPADMLIDFYNHRRALLKIQNEEKFVTSESVLFIDSLIERECGGKILQEQWRNDGGNGLYPPPSLQALLRTYLVDNVDLSYKHSVIIYVFLDLAMTLDQDRYKPVITHLIKFPAVFKVSPSVIKITQAFWQLDHTDFNTAMGLLLDPLILAEDLSQWHHKVVLRALMLQKQHHFALLYLQVRKPVFDDDGDILAIIRLYVANNMIDEAFYFKKYCISEAQENKFLLHLLNECKENYKLKSLLYRSFNSSEENFFLKYLSNSEQPESKDLLVYYHILQSHFIEAFESHDRTFPNKIENQGLFGQENAIPREKLVHTLKKLLPDINRKLLNFCHKERTNTWQEVTRPTPMSVFVHNMTENVQYKSSLIGAALAKAKQTFNETVNQKYTKTEGTPFLRTPTVTLGSKRSSAVIVNPKIIDMDAEDVDTSSPSAKRLKLSPRNTSFSSSIPSKLDTPLVKRKTPSRRDGTEERKIATPQSILKVKSISRTPSKSGNFEDDFKEFEKLEYTPVSSMPKKSGLGLSPRKSLVRFEGVMSTSSDLSTTRNSSLSINASSEKLSLSPSKLNVSSKNTSEEDVYYSPDASLEAKISKESKETSKTVEEEEKNKTLEVSSVIEEPKSETSEEKPVSSPVYSPRGRRSYRRSLVSSVPVRSSPRLSRNKSASEELPLSPKKQNNESLISLTDSLSESSVNVSNTNVEDKVEESTIESPKPSPIIPKLRSRKSLCRKVLELNAANRVLQSPLDSPRTRRSKIFDSPKSTIVEEKTEKLVFESKATYEDGEETHNSSFIKKHNLTRSFVESDADSSDYSFDWDNKEGGPALSDSMLKYINTSYNAISTRNKTLDDTNNESTAKENLDEIETEKEDEKISPESSIDAEEPNQSSFAKNAEETSQIYCSTEEKDESQPLRNEECNQNTSPTLSLNTTGKSMAYSVLDSSADIFSISYDPSGPQLSESMLRCIDNREIEDDKAQEEDEVMEVDEEVDLTEDSIEKDKSEELVYADLTASALIEPKEDVSIAQNKEKESVETFDGDSVSNNRPIDPEMNVFEISDDLSFNDGLIIEKEVTLEENDLCYGQQNTLENVLEENIRGVSSTSLTAFEKNAFNESFDSEELGGGEEEEENDDDDDDDEQQEEPHLPEEHEELSEDKSLQKDAEDEVIEINSSSEDEKKDESESSSSESESSSDLNESFEENYGRKTNIYDEDDYSSEYERHYSEISENSDDIKYEQTKESYGLFQGDIVFSGDEEEEEKAEKAKKVTENVDDAETASNTEENKSDHGMLKEEVDEKCEENQAEDLEENVEKTTTEDKDASEVVKAEIEVDLEEKQTKHSEQNLEMVEVQVEVDLQEKQIKDSEKNLEETTSEQLETKEAEMQTAIDDVVTDKKETDLLKPQQEIHATEDVSIEMDELTYAIADEENAAEIDSKIQILDADETIYKDTQDDEETKDSGNKEDLDVTEAQIEQTIPALECDDLTLQTDNLEEKKDTETKTFEETTCQDTTDTVITNRDILDCSLIPNEEDKVKRRKTRTPSASSSVSPKSTRSQRQANKNTSEETLKLRKRSVSDSVTSRSSRIKKEQKQSEESPLRRSTRRSVDKEMPEKDPTPKQEEVESKEADKKRGRRASSVSHLPKIPEEADSSRQKAKSVVESYSTTRRLTRHQFSMLQRAEGSTNKAITSFDPLMDPIVLLDKVSFDGKPDPEEQKIYDSSPSTSTSSRPTRRLRSASQNSDVSQSSKSKTPVKSVKSRGRKSTDESESTRSTSAKKKLKEIIEDDEVTSVPSVQPRRTRSRAKSGSSVSSDDSKTPEKPKPGKRKQRVTSNSTLPKIQEESDKSDPVPIPKKRTRSNSSQI